MKIAISLKGFITITVIEFIISLIVVLIMIRRGK